MTIKKILHVEIDDNRIYGLDILRALAILFVVLGHGKYILPKSLSKITGYFVFDGVSIFFVLSGFLIGGILIKILNKQQINVNTLFNFWIRRWFRTLPNYFLILVTLLFLNFFFTDGFDILNYKRYFIFSQNLLSVHPNFFPEAWSLSVEEWFYLLIPIILIILIKVFHLSIDKSILLTALGIIVLITLFRYYRYSTLSIDKLTEWDSLLRKQVVTRLDSIMYGIVGSYIYYKFKTFWKKNKIHFLLTGIVLFICIKFNLFGFPKLGLYHCVFYFSAISLATLLLLPFLSDLKNGKGFLFKAITYISLISYSMYLINFILVQKWILGVINWERIESFDENLFILLRYASYWIITIVLSLLIYKFFEIPMMNLRNRFKF